MVRDASKGFFIAGSSIKHMNGIFERSEGLPRKCNRVPIYYKDGVLAYRQEITGWHMALVDATPPGQEQDGRPTDGEGRKTASATEWVFFDRDGNARFRHKGETILPGAGTAWSHVHKETPKPRK